MLNKSYRSTWEIIQFAKRICPNDLIEPVERHGEEPDCDLLCGQEGGDKAD